jgi:hypothetical protein
VQGTAQVGDKTVEQLKTILQAFEQAPNEFTSGCASRFRRMSPGRHLIGASDFDGNAFFEARRCIQSDF